MYAARKTVAWSTVLYRIVDLLRSMINPLVAAQTRMVVGEKKVIIILTQLVPSILLQYSDSYPDIKFCEIIIFVKLCVHLANCYSVSHAWTEEKL